MMKVGHNLGLDINPSKCELITHAGCVVTDPTLSSFQPASVRDAELLGAPLFPGTVLDKVWSQRCDDLARAVDRLALIHTYIHTCIHTYIHTTKFIERQNREERIGGAGTE